MAKNASESRIPLPRTVRPSLLPKIRSLGPTKISSPGHRRGGATTVNNKQQFVVGKPSGLEPPAAKQPKRNSSTPDTDQDKYLKSDYSISKIWKTTTDNKEAEHLMRLNDEKLGILRSQEDLACMKKQSREDVSCADESPVATAPHYLMLTKQNSFEHDESLGILTPDQMTDFTVALETSRTPSCENLSGHDSRGKFLLGKSSAVVAAAARHLDITACVPSIEALIPTNDRSPSLEELPLDPQPVVVVNESVDVLEETICIEETISAHLRQPHPDVTELSTKTVPTDSTETSEHTSEQTRCSAVGHVLPTSFITSVTSITSLEAGYQGDGENSRPASRGPEPISVAPVANLIISATCSLRQDPMTDSDFFTESDADAHEEIVRGDRRAQVIDGTLFCAPNERRCPSFEPGEEMDSSGIYSDLDKRQDSVGVDGDGDHTTDTGDTEISMRSQPSPQDRPVPPIISKNMLSPQEILNETNDSNSPLSTVEVTVIKCQKNEQNTATKSKSNGVSNKENSAPLKKYKMPKRNVSSKIKTMIESNQKIASTKEEPDNDSRRLQRQQRKNGRWEAVMNKIEAGKQRGRSLKKEVKSRVLQGLGTSTSSTASTSSTRRPAEDANNNANNSKDKRRPRNRLEAKSPNRETTRSSVRSSASDLSSAHSKEALKRPTRKNCIDAHQPNNNQLNTNLNKSNVAAVKQLPTIKSVQSNITTKKKNSTTNKVVDRTNRKEVTQVPILNNNNNNNNNNNLHVVNELAGTPPKFDTREQEVQVDSADVTLQALAITVQYFTRQLEETADGRIKSDSDKMKTEWLSARSKLEDLKSRKTSIEDALNEEREKHRQALETLREDLERERFERSMLEDSLQERERELGQVRASQTTGGKDLNALLSEIDSLRTVLELRSQEYNQLRAEAELLRHELEEKPTREQQVQASEEDVVDLFNESEDMFDIRYKRDFEKMKTEWVTTRSELESLRLRESSIEEALRQEREEHTKLVESLREDLDRERSERSLLERSIHEERQRADNLQDSLVERERELGQVLSHSTTSSAQGALLAEVESLRTVLELRSQENAMLRSEADTLRRELDEKELIKQKCEALEARCEDLKAQLQKKETLERELVHNNEMIMGSFQQISKQNKRLSQRNEELLWRLRQKNEVVNVLTNQLTPSSQRLSKSMEPEDSEHASSDANCTSKSESCSMVKYMVEKSDSVSWTLDITETMNTSSRNSTKNSSPIARRYHDTNGTLVSRQGSLRLPMSRRSSQGTGRARSNSVSVAEIPSTADEPIWSPSYNSTPLQRRRTVATANEQAWSLSNTFKENSSVTSNVGAGVEILTTDEEEEEEDIGQRPQEAGGEAMISEETSTSSSSEDDESSISSSDIP